MCTVSFVANNDQVIISSNRDENISRAEAKEIHTLELHNKSRLYFPKDPAHNGTWFAVTDRGDAAVLLNGAFEKHTPAYPYSKSRGIILLELLQKNSVLEDFKKNLLENIEPFTVVYYENKNLYELRWDGSAKHCKKLSAAQAHIWSSATLYNARARRIKEECFEHFITQNSIVNSKDLSAFHLQSSDDTENGFVIKRSNGIETRSFTQAVIYSSTIQLTHQLLSNNQTIQETIPVIF